MTPAQPCYRCMNINSHCYAQECVPQNHRHCPAHSLRSLPSPTAPIADTYLSLFSFAVTVVNLPFPKFNKKLIEEKKKKAILSLTIKDQLTSQFSCGQAKKSGVQEGETQFSKAPPFWTSRAAVSRVLCPLLLADPSLVLFSLLWRQQEFILHYWWLGARQLQQPLEERFLLVPLACSQSSHCAEAHCLLCSLHKALSGSLLLKAELRIWHGDETLPVKHRLCKLTHQPCSSSCLC